MKPSLRSALLIPAFLALALAAAVGGPVSLAAPAPCNYTDVNLNATVQGALTTSDCPLSDGYADYYRFFAAAGTDVSAGIHAPALGDTLLSIQDFQSNSVIVRDDELSNPSVEVKIPTDGFYLVRIWSIDPNIKTGAYTLKLTGIKNPNGCSIDTDPATLCLRSDRFKIRVAWAALHLGTQGDGTALVLTPDTGSFWFFSSTNLELVIKILDGQAINGHFWVFYGALTNVQYTITITDTLTGAVKTYSSAQDTQASVSDTSAF